MSYRRQTGGTLVESAFVILALFVFIFAVLEFGRVFNLYETVVNAAREGARFAAAPCQSGDTSVTSCTYAGYTYWSGQNPGEPIVKAYVQKYLDAANVKGATIEETGEFNTPPGTNIEYNYLRVKVTAPYQWIFLPLPPLTLQSTSVMKNENDIVR